MLLSLHLNEGQNHNIKVANRSFENIAQLRYLGITITNRNWIQNKIKGRLNSGNACYHSVQTISPVVLYGCGTWYLTSDLVSTFLKEERSS
jgi:hypothetical protein